MARAIARSATPFGIQLLISTLGWQIARVAAARPEQVVSNEAANKNRKVVWKRPRRRAAG
jgi:hypothetical protein